MTVLKRNGMSKDSSQKLGKEERFQRLMEIAQYQLTILNEADKVRIYPKIQDITD